MVRNLWELYTAPFLQTEVVSLLEKDVFLQTKLAKGKLFCIQTDDTSYVYMKRDPEATFLIRSPEQQEMPNLNQS